MALNELSIADSFIMGVLRGWRLLQAACLSPEETRDILSTTQNKLDFDAISQALQTLWDEQLLGHRYPSNRQSHGFINWQEHEEPQTWNDWDSHDCAYAEDDWWEWNGDWGEDWQEDEPGDSSLAVVEEELPDEQIQEAQQAEQAAEQLALEAKRTWIEAQRTTQQIRRDRGFGQASASSKGGTRGCFNCGGPHLARDCPDAKVSPFSGKGKSKGAYIQELEHYLNYVKGKGKGKSRQFRSKGRPPQQANWSEAMWTSMRNKGKGYGGSKGMGKPPVNAYTMQYEMGGMELQTPELSLASSLAAPEGHERKAEGMLDCGATASAAPDVAVKGLIQAVLAQDHGARVDIEPYMKPFFRFGNGKWGQALFRVTLSSSISGQHRSFSLYSLPNPEVMDSKHIVPILVGMDHLGPHGCQMLIDFGYGYVIDGADPNPQMYRLNTNSKGHYVYDILYHLTRGKSNHHGHAHVHVCSQDDSKKQSMVLQFRPLEFYNSVVARVDHADCEHRQSLMWKLFENSRRVASSAQMCSLQSSVSPDDIPFREFLRHGAAPSSSCLDVRREGSSQIHQGPQGQESTEKALATTGQGSRDPLRSARSEGSGSVAVLQESRGRSVEQQCSRSLAALRSVQPEIGVYPQERLPEQHHSGAQPQDDRTHAGRTEAPHARCSSNQEHLQGNDGQDHGRRSARDSHPGGSEGVSAEVQGEGSTVEFGWVSKAKEGRSTSKAVKFSEDISKPGKLGIALTGSQRLGHSPHGCREDTAAEHAQGAQGSTGDSDDPGSSLSVGDGGLSGPVKDTTCLTSSSASSHALTAAAASSATAARAAVAPPVASAALVSSTSSSMTSSLQSSMVTGGKPLPRLVAGKVMQMVALLTTCMLSVALEINLDGRDGLWEVACSENSWLTASAIEHGIPSRRINYAQGYDLYQESTWQRLRELRRHRRPKKIWFSLPCTRWCKWSHLNYNTPERRQVLESMRRRERRMLRWAKDFILDSIDEDPDVQFYFEWPLPCDGWHQTPMQQLEQGLRQREVAWEPCRIDGCNYGMMDKDETGFVRKKWLIRTTDELFHKNFRAKTCPQNHQHVWIQGVETSRSAYYPRRMVEAITRHWRRELAPLRHLKKLKNGNNCFLEDENWERRMKPSVPGLHAMPAQTTELEDELPPELFEDEVPVAGDDEALANVSQKDQEAWSAKLQHYHRAAGHPSNRNLIHLFRDAGLPSWKIEMARRHRCAACESLKMGGSSSGKIPPAATYESWQPWQAVGMDAGEWLVPGQKIKLRFVLMMDLATKLKVVHITKQCDFLEMKCENTQDVIRAFSERWLCDKPKPQILIPDNALPLKSKEMHEFCNSIGVQLSMPAEKESWAHGLVESAMKDVKMTASAIQIGQPTLEPAISLLLACAAINSTEYTKGYSAFQWCYGKDYSITDEELRTFQSSDQHGQAMSYEALVRARQEAEQIAKKTRALRVMSRLKNSTVRQPLRTFHPTQLVKVWRKEWPADLHKGKRGGGKKSGKAQWIGPGRVVFHEILPHQKPDDDRRHIVWVLIGTQLMRCSVHSVRPVTETEQIAFEISNKDDPSQWRSLADLLPNRDYTDLTDQVPGEAERESPDLPEHPDTSTMLVPLRRVVQKTSVPPADMVTHEERQRMNEQAESSTPPVALDDSVNDYENDDYSPEVFERDEKRRKVNEPPPDDEEIDHFMADVLDDKDQEVPRRNGYKMAHAHDMKWLTNMVQAEEGEWQDLQQVLESGDDFLQMEFDLNLVSNRSRKDFIRNPNAFLVKKLRDSEVHFGKLSADQKPLFNRAKGKEVNSFLQNQAVRKCLDDQEIKEALGSGRILRARWVLTWKLVPPEDQPAALKDAQTNPSTLHTRDGLRKAKARIVLLGYEHPELGSTDFKTSSPVQSMLARNILYQMVCQHDWQMEGLDLATAFLQTEPTEADSQLWTSGVAELREALQVGPEGVMKIMKNIYGSTTAPRGLWLDLHRTLCGLGGRPAMGERCLWLWASEHEKDAGGHPRVIGIMGGHVDDFHRAGDHTSEEWLAICKKIDSAYHWGTAKRDEYRHAGTDLCVPKDADGDNVITVNQQYYVDMLQDVSIPPERLRDDKALLTTSEIGICRGALGSLQWLAIQTQPQLCARCNIILSELVKYRKMSSALEIQQMIGEVRRQPSELKFFKIKSAKTWQDVIVVTMCDQAHNNRPGGDSTGGLITMMTGPEARARKVCPMVLISWRTWKLRRKSISSNDAEVQAAVEGEDHNFRIRLLWCELHGAGWNRRPQDDQVAWAEAQVRPVLGIVCTDSRGGYDAVQVNESPLLGLSNLRSALQAMQLRENLIRVLGQLRWLASDYDLGDSMTKKRQDCRNGLLKYLKTRLWSIRFDPSFTAAKKNHKCGKSAVNDIDAARSQPDFSFWVDAAIPI